MTALVTAPKPTDGEVQVRREPEPVQVPAAPVLGEEVAVGAVSATAEVVVAATAEVACLVLQRVFTCIWVNLQHE